jgi:hypothetical protein
MSENRLLPIEIKLFCFYVQFIYLFIYCGTGALTQDLHLEPLCSGLFVFVVGIFEIGFCELFVRAGFEP